MKIIAEIGSNWKNINDCLKSIRLAKQAGADIVKFQFFSELDLYGSGSSLRQFDEGELKELKTECDKNNIEFMCTAFSPEGYLIVDKYVSIHKIASSEATSPDILDCVNSFKKPVIISTGGMSFSQIKVSVDRLKNVDNLTIMYCVGDYPAKIIDFCFMESIRNVFKSRHLGYSDHSIDVLIIPAMARDKGAVYLEKHANFCGYQDTDDAPHSLNYDEFRMMVENLNGWPITYDPSNKNMKETHQRRLITLSDGKEGYYRLKK